MSAPRVWLGAEGIVHVDYDALSILTLAAVRIGFEMRRHLSPGRQLVMSRLPGIWRVDAEAAAFLSSQDVVRHTRAQAGVIDSSLGVSALRILEQHHPTPFPLRVFFTEQDARDWLLGLDAGAGRSDAADEPPTLRTHW
jgi:hypothetical protein